MLQRCLALLPSSHRLISNGESDVTHMPRSPVLPMVNSRQMNHNHRHRHKNLSTCVVSLSLLKGHSEIGVETKLFLIYVSAEWRKRLSHSRLADALPSALGGNDIMRISVSTLCLISIVNAAHTLHFGPVMAALWPALQI